MAKFDTFPYRDLLRQVLDSDYRRQKRMSGRHIPICTWLDALNIPQYQHLFHQYEGVEDLIYLTEADIKDVGIRNGGHRAKIFSSLRILREKYEKGRSSGTGFLQRSHSNTSYTNVPVPYPDAQQVIASPEKLRKDLERELAGDPLELRSRSWYHGSVPREHAESIVNDNGDFIVRDCISKPGDFVLTCRWRGTPLNFMINSIVGNCAPGHLPPISFRFEEESFPSIQQLVHYYRVQAKPVTVTSGALLKTPVPRSMPLSYYDTKYGALINFVVNAYHNTPTTSPNTSPFLTPNHSPTDSPNMNRKGVVWTGSHPALNVINAVNHGGTSALRREGHLTPDDGSRSSSLDRCESLPMINLIPPSDGAPLEVAPPPPRKASAVHYRSGSEPVLAPVDNSDSNNNSSDNVPNTVHDRRLAHKKGRSLSPFGHRKLVPASSESELTNAPPPKPSRVPSVKYKHKPLVVQRNKRLDDDDDRDYSDYFQVKEEPSWLKSGISKPKRPLPPTPTSSSPSSNPSPQPQRGRRAQRTNKDKEITPNNLEMPPPSLKTTTTTATTTTEVTPKSPGVQRDSSRVPPIYTGLVPLYRDENQPPPSPSHHFVARSRSFQGQQEDEEVNNDDGGGNGFNDYDNNLNNNVNNKGYSTLPTRSSKKKKNLNRTRKTSETKCNIIDKSNIDYDYPLDNSERLLIHDFLPQNLRRIVPPSKTSLSAIRPDLFTCDLLPKGHKVLDQNVILNVKAILLNKAPRSISLHLTKIDSDLTMAISPSDLGMGVTSGLELMTLPQGSQLRKDIVERWEGLRLFTMLSLLFSRNVTEIAKVMSMWIQACFELKANAGNLYSFSAIMAGLTSAPIHRLKDSWLILRQNHTASAYLFDTKLRPAFACLKDGSSDLPLNNVSVPFILPFSLLLELEEADFLDALWWEEGLDKVGVAIDVLLTHLDTARIIASQCSLYRMTGSALMSKLVRDPDLEVVLGPPFHALLLWGDKGWAAPRKDRVGKLNKIFSLLSHKHQVPGDVGTEV